MFNFFKSRRTIIAEELAKLEEARVNHQKDLLQDGAAILKSMQDGPVADVTRVANEAIDRMMELKSGLDNRNEKNLSLFIKVVASKENKLKGDKLIPIYAMNSVSIAEPSNSKFHIGQGVNYIVYYGTTSVRIVADSEEGRKFTELFETGFITEEGILRIAEVQKGNEDIKEKF